jgi:hypothetical protein
MAPDHRRDFLRTAAAGLAGAGLLPALGATETPRAEASPGLPPHEPLLLPGLHAYAQRSVAMGETLQVRVSSTVPYELQICELWSIDDPNGDPVLQTVSQANPVQQPIHPGSYVHVAKGLPREKLPALSLRIWLRPWRVTGAPQPILSQLDSELPGGFALWLDEQGRPRFWLGGEDRPELDESIHATPLEPHRWHLLVATWAGQSATLWIDGVKVSGHPWPGPILPAAAPLRIGAWGRGGLAGGFLDADIAQPAIYNRALNGAEIAADFKSRGREATNNDGLLAWWPLDEERGEEVAEGSEARRHGQIVNRGTWMIGGPSFDAAAVPRYAEYDPSRDFERGHGLRLASDDLYDCRWNVTHALPVPASQPGIHVARFRFEVDGQPAIYDHTFIVRRSPRQKPKRLLVLCSTNTWAAYSGTPFAENSAWKAGGEFWGTGGRENSVASAPAYCCYRDHHAGQPTYALGVNMPWPVAGPYVVYSPPGVGYSHLMRGEQFLHRHLRTSGYEFDVATDHDLHRDPDLLTPYQAVVINGHSEYWSIPALAAFDKYLDGGGNAVVLSGNTMFWRVSYSPDGQVMECRKYDPAIGGGSSAKIGELWHSDDGRRGSLLRECGHPAWKIVGLDTVGWWDTGPGQFGVYETALPDHFLFANLGLAKGDKFGSGPEGKEPRAVGHEADVRLSTLLRVTTEAPPPGAKLPGEEPAGIQTLALGIRQPATGMILDYFTRPTKSPDGVCAEMIYWERPQGGKIFHGGAIAGAWAISADPKFQKLLGNVLHHFGVFTQKL